MTKRNIGEEIIAGLEEMKAWRKGRAKLKTFTVETAQARKMATVATKRRGKASE